MVKGCAEPLAEPLCFLFNLSLSSGTFPIKWKEARVTPIFKSGDKNCIENYRPVSLLNSFAKVYELLLYKFIFSAIKPKITSQQHGFLPLKSTVTNLMEFSLDISTELDNGGRVDVIYTDFSKAFDKVNHDILLYKISNFGFSPNFLQLMSSYLKDRFQFVSISNLKSSEYLSTSGVPQGSNLGPLLFILFINDLPDCISGSKCLLFADDLKIYKTIFHISDMEILQLSINQLVFWCSNNCLQLNVKKCSFMSYTRQRNIINYNYSISGAILPSLTKIRDLGVIFDSQLKFHDHIDFVTNDAYKLLGFTIRNTQFFQNLDTIYLLYTSLVRSRLEYCCVVWDPYHEIFIHKLEVVQNKFLRYIFFKTFQYSPPRDFPTCQLRNMFAVPMLALRRKTFLLQFLFKIMNNLIYSPYLLAKVNLHVYNRNLRFSDVFEVPFCCTVGHFYFPFIKMLRYYNSNSDQLDIFGDTFSLFTKRCKQLFK